MGVLPCLSEFLTEPRGGDAGSDKAHNGANPDRHRRPVDRARHPTRSAPARRPAGSAPALAPAPSARPTAALRHRRLRPGHGASWGSHQACGRRCLRCMLLLQRASETVAAQEVVGEQVAIRPYGRYDPAPGCSPRWRRASSIRSRPEGAHANRLADLGSHLWQRECLLPNPLPTIGCVYGDNGPNHKTAAGRRLAGRGARRHLARRIIGRILNQKDRHPSSAL